MMDQSDKIINRLIYLLLVITVAFFLIHLHSYTSLENVLLREKVIEYERHLEIIADRVEFNISIDSEQELLRQEARLQNSMAEIDEYPMTYAALYRYENDNIQSVSERTPSYTDVYFEPLQYSEFVQTVMANFDNRERAYTIPLWFEARDMQGRTMYVSYRWTPKYHTGVSYLLVTGISEYTLDMQIPPVVYIVSAIEMALIGALGVLLLKYTNQLIRRKAESYFSNRYDEVEYDYKQ